MAKENNGQAELAGVNEEGQQTVEFTAEPAEPEIRGIASIKILTDGNFTIELLGISQLEAPSLLRVAANRVDKELGIR